MEFRLLGSLEVASDTGDLVDVPGGMLRTALARLLLGRGRVVPVDVLCDALWGDTPPDGMSNALQVQISKLRRVLASGGDAPAIIRRGPGYVVELGTSDVDVSRFEDLIEAARAFAAEGDHASASGAYARALSLWRGDPLADFAYHDFAASERIRLGELRLACLEERIDVELAVGRHVQTIGELEVLVLEAPLRERFWAQLMTAFARSGRPADALRAFRRARERFIEELGLEPSSALSAIESAILQGELSADPQAGSPMSPQARCPLPPDDAFVGRADTLTTIIDALSDGRIVTLVGPGGVGKTRLALEVGRALAATSTTVWFVGLEGTDGRRAVGDALLATFSDLLTDVAGPSITTAAITDRFAAHTAGAEVVMILDNCEHVLDDAAPAVARLLTAMPSLRVLATSREPLGVGGERVVVVDPLAEEDATALFAARADPRASLGGAEPGSATLVAQICQRLGCLPIAIELAAARTRSFSLGQLAARLESHSIAMTSAARVVADRQRSLLSSIAWSYDLLFEDERRLLAQLSVFGGSFTLEAVEAVCGEGPAGAWHVGEQLDRLVHKSLVVADVDTDTASFRLLPPIREFAAARLAEELADATGAMVRDRHLDWVVDSTRDRSRELRGWGQHDAWTSLRHEEANTRQALVWAGQHPDRVERGLAILAHIGWHAFVSMRFPDYFDHCCALLDLAGQVTTSESVRASAYAALLGAGRPRAAEMVERTMDSVALLDDPTARSEARCVSLTPAAFASAATGAAVAADLDRAIVDAAGDRWMTACAQLGRGLAATSTGDLAAGRVLIEAGRRGFAACGDRHGESSANLYLGQQSELAGDPVSATLAARRALERRDGADHTSLIRATNALAWCTLRSGDIDLAERLARESMLLAEQPCHNIVRADASFVAGAVASRRGDLDAAGRLLRRSFDTHTRVGLERAVVLDRAELARLAARSGDVDTAREQADLALDGAARCRQPMLVVLAGLAALDHEVPAQDTDHARALLERLDAALSGLPATCLTSVELVALTGARARLDATSAADG